MPDNQNGVLDTALGVLPLAGAIFDPIMQGVQNRKQRKWNEKMYRWQRTDALADWERQNQYNSPEAQMQRLKDAGLNPNLVYGHGAEGNATGMPRASTAPSWSPKAPSFEGGSVLAAYQNTQIQKAQLENLRANNDLIKQNAAKAAADITLKGIQSDTAKYNLGFKEELRNYYMDIVKWTANNLSVKNTQMLNAVAMQENFLNVTYPKQIQLLEQKVKSGEYSVQKAALEVLNLQLDAAKSRAQQSLIWETIEKVKSEKSLNDVRANTLPVQTGSGVVSSLLSIIRQLTSGKK